MKLKALLIWSQLAQHAWVAMGQLSSSAELGWPVHKLKSSAY